MREARGGPKAQIVALRLKEARLETGLSQRALGILADMDPSVASTRMNYYELGKSMPNLTVLSRIAQALGRPLAYFVIEDDELAELVTLFDAASLKKRRRMLKHARDE